MRDALLDLYRGADCLLFPSWLEGFGLPRSRPDEAPERLTKWLDELKPPQTLTDYAGAAAVAPSVVPPPVPASRRSRRRRDAAGSSP